MGYVQVGFRIILKLAPVPSPHSPCPIPPRYCLFGFGPVQKFDEEGEEPDVAVDRPRVLSRGAAAPPDVGANA